MDAARNALTRFAALAALFDPTTERHLRDRGVGPGWHCLEVDGGGGTIARWLAERVGPDGRVVVTDVDTRFLDQVALENVEVRRHDITRDAISEQAFDLIHTRMVLMHLPARDQVLPRDVHTRLRMESEILWLWEGSDITVVFVTHDLEEAIALSDEVFLLSAGPRSRAGRPVCHRAPAAQRPHRH